MSILWKYLLKKFMKQLFLAVSTFIILLIALKLEEIAQIATLGASGILLFKFILYQVPYILPIAMPIGCLISALLLTQHLSQSHELTALRSSGFSLKKIFLPLLICGFALSLINFIIVSEVATKTHHFTNAIKNELKGENPLFLLHHHQLMRMCGIVVKEWGPSQSGEYASNLLIALPYKKKGRIALCLAGKLLQEDLYLKGKEIALISTIPSEEEGFDTILLDQSDEVFIKRQNFLPLLTHRASVTKQDHLSLRELSDQWKQSASDKRLREELQSEFVRRLSVAIAPFTFTLMGLALFIKIGRTPSRKPLFLALLFTLFYLTSFFLGKNMNHRFAVAAICYFLPHLIIIVFSLLSLARVQKGIEG